MWVGGQRHAPAALPLGKTGYPLYKRLGGPQCRSGRVRKTLPPTGIRSPARPTLASRYTSNTHWLTYLLTKPCHTSGKVFLAAYFIHWWPTETETEGDAYQDDREPSYTRNAYVQWSVLVKYDSGLWHRHAGNWTGTCLGKTLFYHWQRTVIVEKRTVTQPVKKCSYFHVFRRKFCTYFSFLHAAKPLFTVGFCLLLRTQTKTNKRTHKDKHTHVVLISSVGLPTHETKKRNRTRSIHVQICLRQILWDDVSHCNCLPAARYFHKVHLHIQNSNTEKSNNQSFVGEI
jgi:hypothetical protein